MRYIYILCILCIFSLKRRCGAWRGCGSRPRLFSYTIFLFIHGPEWHIHAIYTYYIDLCIYILYIVCMCSKRTHDSKMWSLAWLRKSSSALLRKKSVSSVEAHAARPSCKKRKEENTRLLFGLSLLCEHSYLEYVRVKGVNPKSTVTLNMYGLRGLTRSPCLASRRTRRGPPVKRETGHFLTYRIYIHVFLPVSGVFSLSVCPVCV